MKMTRVIKPVKVSPLIKACRWGFLVLGMIYGIYHLRRLRVSEPKQRIIRENQLKEKYRRKAIELKQKSKEDIEDLAKNLEITEFSPGWDDEL